MWYNTARQFIPFIIPATMLLLLYITYTHTSEKNKHKTNDCKLTTYVVVAYQGGRKTFSNNHIVTATTDKDEALLAAKMEEHNTKNMYMCEVQAFDGAFHEYIKRL
jgi:hypothetical protein